MSLTAKTYLGRKVTDELYQQNSPGGSRKHGCAESWQKSAWCCHQPLCFLGEMNKGSGATVH